MSSRQRKGKVARLPFDIREAVNSMIRDGATAAQLNEFLRGKGFDGPNAANWTNWRQGGYQDWLKEQARLDAVRDKYETIRRELEAGGVGFLDKAIYDTAVRLADSDLSPDVVAQSIAALKSAITGGERVKVAERRAQLADEALTIAKKKFQRDTCDLFVKWCENKKATEIATAPGISEEQRIETLGKLIFEDDW